MSSPSPTEMQLLALVSDEELSGREVAKLFKESTGKAISYGTLYTTFRRLKDAGWVSVRDDEDEDGRIRYFRIDGPGIRALARGREFYRRIATFGQQKGAAYSAAERGGILLAFAIMVMLFVTHFALIQVIIEKTLPPISPRLKFGAQLVGAIVAGMLALGWMFIFVKIIERSEKRSLRTDSDMIPSGDDSRILRLLRTFRWFCSKSHKEDIDLSIADLKRDVRVMHREGRSRLFIRCVLLWQVFGGTIIPILIAAVLSLGKLIRKINGF